MEASLKLGNGDWGVKNDSLLAYDDFGGKFRPLPFDFTRASSATVVNKQGLIETVQSGIPRIDFSDDANGALKLEPQSTNLITYSENFGNGGFWSKTNTTVATSTIVSPDGLQGSYKLVPDNGIGGNRSIAHNYTSLTGIHTHTCFAKKGEYNYLMLRTRNGPNTGVMFDLVNGTLSVNSAGASYVDSKIEEYTNGWYRCSITLDPSLANTVGQLYISMSVGITGTETNSFNGDGTSGVYIYGAQFEQQSYATSYIPTSGATATRNQESCNNATPVINSLEGVLYAEISALAEDQPVTTISISNQSLSNRVLIAVSGGELTGRFMGSTDNTQKTTSGLVIENFNKIACSYTSTTFKVFVNGLQIGTTSTISTALVGLTELAFDRGDGVLDFVGKTKSVQVYTTALTDAELTTLTTI